jgi:hypothetical protein
MDSVIVHRTWVDFGFYVFDAVKGYILPALGGLLAGWIAPTPKSILQKMQGK